MKFLIMLLFINFSFSQSYFKKTESVDEFGDKIGEVQRNISKGTFSNSATNDSPLRVHTIHEVKPDYTLEEFKIYMAELYGEFGFTEKKIKKHLKHAHKDLEEFNNANGELRFYLYEYNDKKASMIGIKAGDISIKTSDGKKIRASISGISIGKGYITIKGYKDVSGVEDQIKYGFYDWLQSEIYNEIINPSGPIQVVLHFRNSNYKFTLE